MNIAPYVAAGVVTDQTNRQITSDQHHLQQHTESLACIYQTLCEIKDVLDTITSSGNGSDHIERINLSPSQQFMTRDHGLRHTMVYSGNNTNAITAEISGIGTIVITLATGWNLLDFPDGTMLTSTAACSLIYKASNWGL